MPVQLAVFVVMFMRVVKFNDVDDFLTDHGERWAEWSSSCATLERVVVLTMVIDGR